MVRLRLQRLLGVLLAILVAAQGGCAAGFFSSPSQQPRHDKTSEISTRPLNEARLPSPGVVVPFSTAGQEGSQEKDGSVSDPVRSHRAEGLSSYLLAIDHARRMLRPHQAQTVAQASAQRLAASLEALEQTLQDVAFGRAPLGTLDGVQRQRQELEAADGRLRSCFKELDVESPADWADYEAKWLALRTRLQEIEQLRSDWERAADGPEGASRERALRQSAAEALAFLEDNATPELDDFSGAFGGVAPAIPDAPDLGPPSLAQRIVPAHVTQAGPPEPEDLTETPEVQITPEIIALAESLDESAIQIYEYVRNSFEIEPYYGSLKGSTATLWTGAGNDYDQASLLIALLRAADIPARYVMGTVTISAEEVEDWLGVIDPHVACDYLAWPCELIVLPDGRLALRMEHVWIEAYVPYSNYGGTAIDESGPVWVPLDPSFKMTDYQGGLDLPADLDFDREGFLSGIDLYLPSEVYEDQVWDHMREHMPGHALSEVGCRSEIIPESLELLPMSLPYRVDAVAGEYAEVPDDLRYKVTVTLKDYGSGQTLLSPTSLVLPEVSVSRITISYEESGGSLVHPLLAVEGEAMASGGDTTLGDYNVITVGFAYPRVGQVFEVTDYRRAGTYMALAVDAHQAGERLVAERGRRLLAAVAEEDQDALLGELLYLVGMRYWHHCDQSEARVGHVYHYVLKKYLRYGLLSSEVDVTYLFDRPFSFTSRGLNLDVGLNWLTRLPIDGDDSQAAEVAQIAGMDSSSLEHQIWEEVVVIDSVSTIKGLQYASEQGIPIYSIDQSNIDTIMPLLTLSQGVKDTIRQHVNEGDGWTVMVHRDPITYNQWHGAVWIQEDPATGNAGYWISGSLQGGSTSCDPAEDPNCTPPDEIGARGEPLDQGCAAGEFPVTFSNGNMYHRFTDLLIPTRGPALQLIRTYNAQSDETGPFGYGWTHNYQMRLSEVGGTGDVMFLNESGGRYLFVTNGDGTYESPFGLFLTLTKASGMFELRNRYGTVWAFDGSGRLMSITNRNGNAQTLAYSGGRLSTVSDALGRELTFTYDGQGRITAVSDFAGRTWSYAYQGGELASSTTPSDSDTLAYTTHYDYYDEQPLAHNLRNITDPRGYSLSFAYYADDKVFQTIDQEGDVTTYRYLPFRRETQVVSEPGAAWTFRYDPHGFTAQIRLPDGSTRLRAWDGVGNLTAYTDGLGYTTEMTYDGRGNLLTTTDPLNHTTSATYDPTFSQPTSFTDARGNTTTFAVDPANGNRLSVTDPLGHVMGYTYDGFGNLTSVTDANGHITTFSYDANNYLSEVRDGRGETWLLVHDSLGRLTSVTNPLSETATFAYDALSRVLSTTDGEGQSQAFSYDGNGNLTEWEDANGRTTTYAYDGRDNLARVTDAAGNSYQVGYGNVSCPVCAETANPTSFTDPNGRVRRYAYDVLDRLVRESNALGLTRRYTYDAQDNLIGFKDERGALTRYSYDPLGRLLHSQFPDGSEESFSYDAHGNLRTAANVHTTLTYGYDARNQVTQVHDSALNETLRYSYDGVGNRATMTDADGVVWRYDYDESDNLISLEDFGGVVTTFSYDAAGRLTRSTPRGGHPGVDLSLSYDQAGRVTGLTNASRDGGTTFADFVYAYDERFHVTDVTVGGIADFGALLGETGYSYDAVYQLTGFTWPDGSGESYDYDAAGNRIVRTPSGGGPARGYYDETDRLTYGGNDGNTHYTYDRRGNLLTKSTGGEVTTYTWDDQNRLVRVDLPDGSQASYVYDALGRRIGKTLSDGTVVRYLYDGPNLLQTFDNRGRTLAKYAHALTVDHPVSMRRDGQTYYYLYDRRGSIIGLTDGAEDLEASYVYDPWGNVVGGEDGGIENPFRYTGREHDLESGLAYHRARYYDPGVGRFISRDPIGLAGELNPYAYASGDPVNRVDRDGLQNRCLNGGDSIREYGLLEGLAYATYAKEDLEKLLEAQERAERAEWRMTLAAYPRRVEESEMLSIVPVPVSRDGRWEEEWWVTWEYVGHVYPGTRVQERAERTGYIDRSNIIMNPGPAGPMTGGEG